jgi:hypothetical protein
VLEEDPTLPGLPIYAFQRGSDPTVLCFAQTDLDALYPRYPGLKKAIAKQMRDVASTGDRLYFKTKPSENRADFSACFSNNATNGKCLVPVPAVHAALAELDVEREMRRDSIAAFVSRMSRHEKEWVLQELVQSIGVSAAPAALASGATSISTFAPAAAGDGLPTPPLAAPAYSPSSPASSTPPLASQPPPSIATATPLAQQPSFFDMFVRARNLGASASAVASTVSATATAATPSAVLPRSSANSSGNNSNNSSFSLVLEEAETNPLFGSLSLFAGELDSDQRDHKRKRMNSIDTDDLPTLAVPVAALVAAPQVAAAVRAPFVPMARDREWTQPAPQPPPVNGGEYNLEDGSADFLQRDGSLLFGLRAGRTSPGIADMAAPAAHIFQSASDLLLADVATPASINVAASASTTTAIAPRSDRMLRGLRSLKAHSRAAFL